MSQMIPAPLLDYHALLALEEDREPSNSARNNLQSLELCFAAIQSADTGVAVTP